MTFRDLEFGFGLRDLLELEVRALPRPLNVALFLVALVSYYRILTIK